MQTGNGSAVNLGNSFVDFEIPVTLEFQETEADMENITAQKGISQTIEISDGSQNLFQVIRPPSDRTTYFYGRRDGEATNSSYDFRVAINGASSSRKKRSTTASSQPDVNSTITVDVSQDSNGELSLYVPAEGLDGASSFNLLILADGVGSANGSSQKLTMKSTVINPRFYNAATKSWNSSSGLQDLIASF
ncbi:uncharacterized protein LOC106181621 [Lingula anatina]|uniref:Uncharacterized protein LOC106181621 n=1 Tax=Lingula anatina TaxID=7574 RepID=A0A1S3KFW3_LINAN|nr:uncharacterized protein LOC106181621 [Lingula anatina]|eukprot:XP_013421528.1 uncharacterized protein LOC106181621 [Lingula anatina]